MSGQFLLAFAIALVPLSAAAGQIEQKDLQVLNDIARQVDRYSRLTVFDDVSASVRDGVVTLTGKVTMPVKRDAIGRLAMRVPGVRSVQNRVEVLPVSPFDDEIRYQVARAIYGNSAFWNYAAMPNPPIHVVVDRGRVTLTGVVSSDVERTLARSLASSCGAFSVTSELKTDAEMRAAAGKVE